MAPKRARTIDSSSTVPTADSSRGTAARPRLTDRAAEEEYTRLLGKPILKERGFLPSGRDGELLPMIAEKGWIAFCESPEAVPMSVVREFYANAKAEKNGFSVVRGLTVDYHPAAIRRVIGQRERKPEEENWNEKTAEDFDLDLICATLCRPGTVWTRSPGNNEYRHFPAIAMNRYARAWNAFICANILPSSHAHEVTVERAQLLWGILNEEYYVDLGEFIYQGILKFLRGAKHMNIPYASTVTKLCRAVGVNWPAHEQLQLPAAPIDSGTLNGMQEWTGGEPEEHGLGYRLPGGRPARGATMARPGRGEASSSRAQEGAGMGDAQYRRLSRRMDAMYETQSRFAQELTLALGTAFRGLGADIQWPVFGEDSAYPPPDTPPTEGDDDDDSE